MKTDSQTTDKREKKEIGLGGSKLFISPHIMKTDDCSFVDIMRGIKKCEVRNRNDRRFNIGDTLILKEWDRAIPCTTGREIVAIVTHIQDGYGLPCEICVLSFNVLEIRS